MATLRITRDSGLVDCIRRYKVVLDGKVIGDIGDGETRDFDVADGEHKIWLRIDWCRSNKVVLLIHNDDAICFECGSNLKDRVWLGLFYVLFAPHRYIWLKQTSEAHQEGLTRRQRGGFDSKLGRLSLGGVALVIVSILGLVAYILSGASNGTAVRVIAMGIVVLSVVNGLTIALWLSKRLYGRLWKL